MYKVYIIEDDISIASTLARHLASWGLHTQIAKDFHNILAEFTAFGPHLVLLDISLPFYNGFHWCEQIRGISRVPIIFLSSASDNMNIVLAIDMGGDDFIAKPFDLHVLTAKVQALLRRTYHFGTPEHLQEYGGVTLNLADGTVTFSGQTAELTKNEQRILQCLFEGKGNPVQRETLMNRLWETDCYIDDNTLTVNINRLRQKLKGLGLQDFILTKKGIGYQLKK